MSISKDKEIQAPEAKKQKMSHGKGNQNLDSPIRASARFSGLPELIEMTLLHVPALRILVIQRTNTMFHNTVKSSVSIQRKLFYQHDPHNSDVNQIEGNPFLHRFGTSWSQASTTRVFGNITTTDLLKHNHPNASWRKMLVSMPTGKRLVAARINSVTDWSQSIVLLARRSENGLRMWQVADHVWEGEKDLLDLIYMEVMM